MVKSRPIFFEIFSLRKFSMRLTSGASGIFFRTFLKKQKLHNLIKREIHILTTIIIKKNAQIHKVYNFLLRVFIFWNRCMIVSLSMLQATSFSMYITKQCYKFWACYVITFFFFFSDFSSKNFFFGLFLFAWKPQYIVK